MAVQSGLCWTWSETPKTGFLTTRLIFVTYLKITVYIQASHRIHVLQDPTGLMSPTRISLSQNPLWRSRPLQDVTPAESELTDLVRVACIDISLQKYRNNPKFLDRHAGLGKQCRPRSTLSTFPLHVLANFSTERLLCLNFRIIITNILGTSSCERVISLTPHFYIVNLELTGVYIIFLFLL